MLIDYVWLSHEGASRELSSRPVAQRAKWYQDAVIGRCYFPIRKDHVAIAGLMIVHPAIDA